jgi:hypothetical protein
MVESSFRLFLPINTILRSWPGWRRGGGAFGDGVSAVAVMLPILGVMVPKPSPAIPPAALATVAGGALVC